MNNLVKLLNIADLDVGKEACIGESRELIPGLRMPNNFMSIRQLIVRFNKKTGREHVTRVIEGCLYVVRIK